MLGVKEESVARQQAGRDKGGVSGPAAPQPFAPPPTPSCSGELGLDPFCLRSSMHGRVGARIAPPCRSHPRQNKRRPRRPAPGRDWCSPVRSVKTHDETVPKLEDHATRTVLSWFGSWLDVPDAARPGAAGGSRLVGCLLPRMRTPSCRARFAPHHHHRLEWRVRPPTPLHGHATARPSPPRSGGVAAPANK